MANRYTVSTFYRLRGSMFDYVLKGAVVLTPDGQLVAVPLDGDTQTADQVGRDVQFLISGTGGPDKVLDYLYERNSTVTTYSKPVTLVADSPLHAAQKQAAKESAR